MKNERSPSILIVLTGGTCSYKFALKF